jgi:hypothetical protein
MKMDQLFLEITEHLCDKVYSRVFSVFQFVEDEFIKYKDRQHRNAVLQRMVQACIIFQSQVSSKPKYVYRIATHGISKTSQKKKSCRIDL